MTGRRGWQALGAVAVAIACAIAIRAANDDPRMPDFTRPDDATSDVASVDVDGTWSEGTAPEYYVVVGEAPDSLPDEVTDDRDVTTSTTQAGVEVPATSEIRATHDDVTRASGTERPDLPDPAMWPHNFRAEIACPDGSVYHGWFWNRSHMVARSLGGADEARNLVAGTRMQNVGGNDGEGGMAYAETRARDYLKAHPDGWVAYRVTANYLGMERIPRTCTVESLSDDGSIDETVVVYNAAKGYSIDYSTGDVTKDAA